MPYLGIAPNSVNAYSKPEVDSLLQSKQNSLGFTPLSATNLSTGVTAVTADVVTFKKAVDTLTSTSATGATNIDVSAASTYKYTITGNTTFSFTNVGTTACFSFTVITVNDATAGRTIAWPAGVKWAGGVIPPRTTAANAIDFWYFATFDTGTTWYGSLSIADGR